MLRPVVSSCYILYMTNEEREAVKELLKFSEEMFYDMYSEGKFPGTDEMFKRVREVVGK